MLLGVTTCDGLASHPEGSANPPPPTPPPASTFRFSLLSPFSHREVDRSGGSKGKRNSSIKEMLMY